MYYNKQTFYNLCNGNALKFKKSFRKNCLVSCSSTKHTCNQDVAILCTACTLCKKYKLRIVLFRVLCRAKSQHRTWQLEMAHPSLGLIALFLCSLAAKLSELAHPSMRCMLFFSGLLLLARVARNWAHNSCPSSPHLAKCSWTHRGIPYQNDTTVCLACLKNHG